MYVDVYVLSIALKQITPKVHSLKPKTLFSYIVSWGRESMSWVVRASHEISAQLLAGAIDI